MRRRTKTDYIDEITEFGMFPSDDFPHRSFFEKMPKKKLQRIVYDKHKRGW